MVVMALDLLHCNWPDGMLDEKWWTGLLHPSNRKSQLLRVWKSIQEHLRSLTTCSRTSAAIAAELHPKLINCAHTYYIAKFLYSVQDMKWPPFYKTKLSV